jgi:hypothetical protein
MINPGDALSAELKIAGRKTGGDYGKGGLDPWRQGILFKEKN